MKKIYFVTIGKNFLNYFLFSSFIAVTIILLNIFYFSNTNKTIETSLISEEDNDTGPVSYSETGGKLAIIIDDFGQNRDGVKEMMSIDRHITLAIMPFLSFSQSDAKTAHAKGFEVIVHLPMESNKGNLNWVGPRPIMSVMSNVEVQQLVMDTFDNVPFAVGANIHMGSKAGEDERIISNVLDIIKSRNLYFVDSRAGRHPIAKAIADSKGVICYNRDVFLDGKQPKEYIKKQLKKSCDIALKMGSAVAIGHVGIEGGKVTAQSISEMLPEIDRRNISLVFVSELNK